MMALDHGMAPGAADKWKVLQLFHEGIPRARARVERIDRVVDVSRYGRFVQQHAIGDGGGTSGGASGSYLEGCDFGFYVSAGQSHLARLSESGFNQDDIEDVPVVGFGVPVAFCAGFAHQLALLRESNASQQAAELAENGSRCLCVVLHCSGNTAGAGGGSAAANSPLGSRSSSTALGTSGRCLVSGGAGSRSMASSAPETPSAPWQLYPRGEWQVLEPEQLLLTHVVWYQVLHMEDRGGRASAQAGDAAEANGAPATCESPHSNTSLPSCSGAAGPGNPVAEVDQRLAQAAEKRRKGARLHKEYVRACDSVIREALQGLQRVDAGTMTTVLLPSTSIEAESVVSLYLLGGGGSRTHRPPGVNSREALGGVIVQRIENKPLFAKYCDIAADGNGLESLPTRERAAGASGQMLPRYREDVVWHGTRLKRMDGEGTSLATKLQSIAEQGFDPQRCMKGKAAEGGIWLATSPLASFGHGGDGLVAFILCLAKTHFNEWVDATCARVLQRERVLPLYSLVHA